MSEAGNDPKNQESEADRPPTTEEEQAAERAASHVDPESGEAFKREAERGADVKGEGEITPD